MLKQDPITYLSIQTVPLQTPAWHQAEWLEETQTSHKHIRTYRAALLTRHASLLQLRGPMP